MQRTDPRKIAVRDKRGGARWHEIWNHNPRFAVPGEACDVQWLENYSGHRPYIDYTRTTRERYHWREYHCEPGEIVLTKAEQALARETKDCVVIEPNLKTGAAQTKDWGHKRWQELATKLRINGYSLVQLGAGVQRELRGVRRVFTRNVREAAGALSGAIALVSPEGGLHHCAAALGVPAVVIRGGFIGPRVTGYAGQADLFVESEEWPLGCGVRSGCPHCAAAMESITRSMVSQALQKVLGKK